VASQARIFQPPLRVWRSPPDDARKVLVAFHHDLDRDGKQELLVAGERTAGVRGSGIRVWRNRGTVGLPEFEASDWLVCGRLESFRELRHAWPRLVDANVAEDHHRLVFRLVDGACTPRQQGLVVVPQVNLSPRDRVSRLRDQPQVDRGGGPVRLQPNQFGTESPQHRCFLELNGHHKRPGPQRQWVVTVASGQPIFGPGMTWRLIKSLSVSYRSTSH